MTTLRTGRTPPSREVKALLLRSKREHDAAAVANMRQAQVHLECAQAIVHQLRTLDRRIDGR